GPESRHKGHSGQDSEKSRQENRGEKNRRKKSGETPGSRKSQTQNRTSGPHETSGAKSHLHKAPSRYQRPDHTHPRSRFIHRPQKPSRTLVPETLRLPGRLRFPLTSSSSVRQQSRHPACG